MLAHPPATAGVSCFACACGGVTLAPARVHMSTEAEMKTGDVELGPAAPSKEISSAAVEQEEAPAR